MSVVRTQRDLLIATASVAVILFCAKPVSFWEFDEPLFAQALHRYDPIAHHPPPPGYPLFIFVATLARAVVPSDFAALVAVSVIASLAGFVLLALAFARIAGDRATGICGALLFYLSPAMLVHSTLPISEPGALSLLAAALLFSANSPAAFGAFAALTVGWRPQFSIFVLPLLFARRPSPRTLAVFTLVCLAWLLPLTAAVGGVERLIAFETGQAKYFAAHDAGISRSVWSPAAIAVSFISHPWGPRVMALPLLAAACIGAWRMRTRREILPIAIAAVVYIVMALAAMDPADAVRYAIPFSLFVSLLVAVGIATTRRYALTAVFAIGSIIYVSAFVVQRSTTPSPPMQAAAFARTTMPPRAVVGYEMPLWPHATYLFGDHPLFRIDGALQQVTGSLYDYANGYSELPGARNFAWDTNDAYWNLTRNQYRVVSWSPVTPERRFRAIRGVYALEREHVGESWRWLDVDAALDARRAAGVELRLALPASYPFESNAVQVLADGQRIGTVRIRRGDVVRWGAAFDEPVNVIELRSEHAFTPPHDPRRLAVELYDLILRFPTAVSTTRAASNAPANTTRMKTSRGSMRPAATPSTKNATM